MALFDDPFFKAANVFDTAGVVGVVLGIASIWVTYRLTKLDIQRRIREAVDEAAQRFDRRTEDVKLSFLRLEVSEFCKDTEAAGKYLEVTQWDKARASLDIALKRLIRILASDALPAEHSSSLTTARDGVMAFIEYLHRRRISSESLPSIQRRQLDKIIRDVTMIEQRMQPHNLGASRAQAN